jgi:hypothetical protein
LTDVGSQNAVSRKFITQFEDVHGCLFVVSLADYALYSEDSKFNSKLEESFQIFRTLVSTPSFVRKPIGLILTKRDLFERLLLQVPFSEMFEKYAGDNTTEAVIAYITQEFQKCFPTKTSLSPSSSSSAPSGTSASGQIKFVLPTSCLPESSNQICSSIADFARAIHPASPMASPRDM